MKKTWVTAASLLIALTGSAGAHPLLSAKSEECLDCHEHVTPGIVADWAKSRHAHVTPAQAAQKQTLQKRVSFTTPPRKIADKVVGCAECHTLNPELHKDSFEHNGSTVHVVVSPPDCALCHPVEVEEYGKNLMSRAYGNLRNNALYHNLADSIVGEQNFVKGKIVSSPPDEKTKNDSCFKCHGSKVEVKGMVTRDTEMGEMAFPVLSGWPNQGVGRLNPDGSKGSCSACHPRHQFSIEVARKPYTCSQCHKGPDTPAYQVYMVSKHGNIFSSLGKEWNFKAVPWTVGRDFTAPTCAVCHISLLVTEEGKVVASRTHRMNDRLPWRIFGLIYAHPHPKSPDTTIIKNKAGLGLPTELTGEPVAEYLIDAPEQEKRLRTLKKVCRACHSRDLVEGHFASFFHTIEETNQKTLTATRIIMKAWNNGAAKGPAQHDSVFNESIEKKWVKQWLFYANSTRFASAMMGADYGVFAGGRWFMSQNTPEMADWLENELKQNKGKKK